MSLLARFRSTHYVLVFWCGQTPLTGSGRSASKSPGPGLPHPLSSLSPIDSPTSSGIPVQVISSDANQVTTVLGHLVQTTFFPVSPHWNEAKGTMSGYAKTLGVSGETNLPVRSSIHEPSIAFPSTTTLPDHVPPAFRLPCFLFPRDTVPPLGFTSPHLTCTLSQQG